MNNDLICDQCKFVMVYDAEMVGYLECPCCGKVLVNADSHDVDVEGFVIVDHGTAYGSKWIKVKDSNGNQDIYWAKSYSQ